jgi:hypothetical protein
MIDKNLNESTSIEFDEEEISENNKPHRINSFDKNKLKPSFL